MDLTIELDTCARWEYKRTMVKINHYVSEAELAWLRKQAEKMQLTVSEVLRRIIDAARGAR